MDKEMRDTIRALINELLAILEDEEELGEDLALTRQRLEYLVSEIEKFK